MHRTSLDMLITVSVCVCVWGGEGACECVCVRARACACTVCVNRSIHVPACMYTYVCVYACTVVVCGLCQLHSTVQGGWHAYNVPQYMVRHVTMHD